jgi:hypothetical protein
LTSSGKHDVPLLSVLLPQLNQARNLARILAAEATAAAERGDVDTFERCLRSITLMGEHFRGPFLVDQLVAIGIDRLTVDVLSKTLTRRPNWFDRKSLQRITHQLSRVGETSPLIDLAGERMFFHDAIQRTYTDDGHGDGRLNWAGLQTLLTYGSSPSSRHWPSHLERARWLNNIMLFAASRRDVLAEYDRLLDTAEAAMRRPASEANWADYETRMSEIKSSPTLSARYLPITLLPSSIRRAGEERDRLVNLRDGMLTVLALEAFRREHGVYPTSLDALVPKMLPAVPVDRIGGGAIRYRLVGGKPVVYSVGVDRNDDGGRPPEEDGVVLNARAAEWNPDRRTTPDGDWVLFPDPSPVVRSKRKTP